MVYRLVIENLKHRPVRTLLSALAIGVQVTMILALVGVSRGVLGGMAARNQGTGADIIIRPPDSSVLGFGLNMPEGIVGLVREQPHVAEATGTLVHPVGNLDSITGIQPEEFNQMSGGLVYIDGKQFETQDDLVVDEVFAADHDLEVGSTIELGHVWNVTGIVEQGKLSRTFTDIETLGRLFAETGKVSMVMVKVDDPANIDAVVASLQQRLADYKIYPMEEFISLFTVSSVPLLQGFTRVVIGIAGIVGFLIVFLSMYMAVLERTREIGILKALGASPGYILGILLRETIALAIVGTVLGIVMAYGTQALLARLAPGMPQVIVPDWYPWAALIALTGSLIGALYPGMKAARQDAIEALAYD